MLHIQIIHLQAKVRFFLLCSSIFQKEKQKNHILSLLSECGLMLFYIRRKRTTAYRMNVPFRIPIQIQKKLLLFSSMLNVSCSIEFCKNYNIFNIN